jgi:hypothetical protein
MEREAGIEPAPSAWKAEVLPLNYSRVRRHHISTKHPSIRHRCASKVWLSIPHRKTQLPGGGRWMTPGFLPFALRAATLRVTFRIAPAILSNHSDGFRPASPHFSTMLALIQLAFYSTGGGRWIRTTEGRSQQIYSLPPLAAWVFLHGAAHSGHARSRCQGVYLLIFRLRERFNPSSL